MVAIFVSMWLVGVNFVQFGVYLNFKKASLTPWIGLNDFFPPKLMSVKLLSLSLRMVV